MGSGATVPAVVLAAGASSRMGEAKLLATLGGKPVIQHVIETLRAAGLESILVVLGCREAAIRSACEGFDDKLDFVINPNWRDGRVSSVHAALDRLKGARGLLICPGDVPFIGADLVCALLDRFRSKGRLTFPLVGGEKGHPVIFPARSFPLLEALDGEGSLRDYMLSAGKEIDAVAWKDSGCLFDLDCQEDLEAARRMLSP